MTCRLQWQIWALRLGFSAKKLQSPDLAFQRWTSPTEALISLNSRSKWWSLWRVPEKPHVLGHGQENTWGPTTWFQKCSNELNQTWANKICLSCSVPHKKRSQLPLFKASPPAHLQEIVRASKQDKAYQAVKCIDSFKLSKRVLWQVGLPASSTDEFGWAEKLANSGEREMARGRKKKQTELKIQAFPLRNQHCGLMLPSQFWSYIDMQP